MKYIKLLAFLLGAVALTSCLEKDKKPDYNTNPDIKVFMAKEEVTYKENQGIVKVPVALSGETNGYVTVECTVKEYSENPAMEDVHYILTSKSLTFDVAEKEGSFELKLIDDDEPSETPRQFIITLVSAQGATVGAPKETIVIIKDNDSNPYERLAGEWNVPCYNWNGSSQNVKIKIATPEDDDPDFGYVYDIYGVIYPGNLEEYPIRANVKVNEAENTSTITVKYGQEFTYEGNQGLFCYISADGYITTDGTVTLYWDAEVPTEIHFVDGPQDGYFDWVSIYNDGGWYLMGTMMGCQYFVK